MGSRMLITLWVSVLFLVLFMVGCTDISTSGEKTSEPVFSTIFDNEIAYQLDMDSELTIDDFAGITTLTQLKIACGNATIRETEGIVYELEQDPEIFSLWRENGYYCIYTSKDGTLIYVFLQSSLYTGIDFFVTNCIEYPSEQIDERFYGAILDIDHPQNIMGSQGSD